MKVRIRKAYHRFLDRRIPVARRFELNHKSIFIFPSKFGWLFLVLCIGIFILGTNYQNNLMLLLCFFLMSLFLLNLFVAYFNFARLSVQLGKTHNEFVGERAQLPLWFTLPDNEAQRPHGLVEIGFIQQPAQLQYDLDSGQNPIKVAFTCEKRGQITLPRVTIASFYPMGLFRCWTHLGFDADILAYPKPVPCAVQLTTHQQSADLDTAQSNESGFDDFDSLKNYRPGEPLYHVAWKQFAKGQGMYSKQFSNTVSASGWLNLLPCSADVLELKLGQLSHQVNELTRRGQHFGLDLGQQRIEPDAGPLHQQRCLEALARFNWVKT